MPIEAPALVAVTGANGFIAQHCIAALLEKGYRVVGTVRSHAKVDAVRQAHAGGGAGAGAQHPKLSVVVVADITDPDQYRAALEPLSPAAVLHLASPFHYRATDFERELMVPAVRGATALLEACAAMRSVKRVVHTNSFACIYDAAAGLQPAKTYTARDWSPLTYADGVDAADAATAYRACKTAAERAAWRFVAANDKKSRAAAVGFDLVSLCPAMVFGPFLPKAKPRSIADVNTSNLLVWAVAGADAGAGAVLPPTKGPVWVDVRDVADAHVRALAVPEAGGRRFLLAQGVYCNQELADVARKVLPPAYQARIPLGKPGVREAHTHFGVDATETERVLGVSWRGLEDCLRDLVPQLYEIEAQQNKG
ncbi:dihydroflavonal-4-reductase protein [Beauveria bassiana ARSEF 2860]|uniref:Dihydroflavonal-4-reductase protein n=1 Tax=Beauveria bassiana (strain ARSEF 2860) TaxID=655819 RepID=J4W375_BEAB2|nr:dihydroflavonal-4-reductase protein [Beauveria bassiana ARSEF 2860]EJP64880.1 dihydroflavonal-4-reductase protein [Beauveria bassiana ARSEF 2860]